MFAIYTSIPLLLGIIAFLITARTLFQQSNVNQETKRVHRLGGFAFIAGTIPMSLTFTNSILYHYYPDDHFIPWIVDRFSSIGAFLGIFLILIFDFWILIRFSVLFEVDRVAAKRFGIAFFTLVTLTTLPVIVEAILFSAKVIEHGNWFFYARYIAFFGGANLFCLYIIVRALLMAYKLNQLYQAKNISTVGDRVMLQKIFPLYMGCVTCLLAAQCSAIVFTILPYRSNFYILFVNLAGFFIAITAVFFTHLAMALRNYALRIIKCSQEYQSFSQSQQGATGAQESSYSRYTISLRQIVSLSLHIDWVWTPHGPDGTVKTTPITGVGGHASTMIVNRES